MVSANRLLKPSNAQIGDFFPRSLYGLLRESAAKPVLRGVTAAETVAFGRSKKLAIDEARLVALLQSRLTAFAVLTTFINRQRSGAILRSTISSRISTSLSTIIRLYSPKTRRTCERRCARFTRTQQKATIKVFSARNLFLANSLT